MFCCQTKACHLILTLSLVLFSCSFLFYVTGGEKATDFDNSHLIIGTTSFDLIIADDEMERIKGLSGRESILANQVMLFVFPNIDFHGIWMKDMNFSIDIVWLDQNFRVSDLKQEISPETFPEVFKPKTKSRYVLEFPAETLKNLQINIGDEIKMPNFDLN